MAETMLAAKSPAKPFTSRYTAQDRPALTAMGSIYARRMPNTMENPMLPIMLAMI